MIGRAALLAGSAFLLMGCQTTQQASAPASPPPSNYRSLIVEYSARTLNDPYSIRSAEISEPKTSWAGLLYGGNVMTVCARFNAKNRFGAYIGVTPVAYIFYEGEVAHSVQNPPTACADHEYSPFPELENIS